ncbi:MAG: insulinase family protein, partial [Burkholderiaceae bacterium]|nr:insulinase family protein [Burkholderiaceae bacterium]
EAKTLNWIAQAFGKIPKPKRTLPTLWTVEPTHDGERSFTVRRPGEVQLVILGYRVPSALSPQSLATNIAADVLGDTPNGRMHEALVASGKAAQVFNYNIDGREPGFILFGAVVKKGEPLEPVRQAMIDVVEGSWGKVPATDAELKRQVQMQRTAYERALADPQGFGVGLSEYISLGDWRLFFLQRDQLAKLTAGEVDTAARKYFVRDNRVTGLYVPEDTPLRAEIPTAPSAQQRLADYRPSEKGAVSEAFVPSQENIDKRTRVLSFGDLNVALLPKQNRGATVTVQTQFKWGNVESLTGHMIEGDLAAGMLTRGTDKMTRQQIADEMTRLQITGGLTGFQTTRENLPDALRLLAQVMRSASFPATEYEQLQRQAVTGLQAQLDNPEAVSRDALNAHFNTYPAGDPRYYIPMRARIEAIGKTPLDATRRFHADFYGTARGDVAVVGDFDGKQIEALVNQLFTDYRSKAPYARLEREYREVKPARLTVDTPEKENALIRARIDLPLRDDDLDAPALTLANDIFGGGSGLSNRVIDRLRQRDGLSYGAGTSLALGSRYRLSSWTLGAIMAPQNVAKAESALRDEIARARRDGFTARELDDAKKGTLQDRANNRAQDAVLASAWAANLDLGRTFAFSKQFEDRLRAVTLEQLNAAFRKYIDPERMTFVIAGDAKKGAQ